MMFLWAPFRIIIAGMGRVIGQGIGWHNVGRVRTVHYKGGQVCV